MIFRVYYQKTTDPATQPNKMNEEKIFKKLEEGGKL